jgi:probable rRNA maturation factor
MLMKLIEEDEEPPDSCVNIIFVRDSQIIKLNKNYRKINKPTDVLSFNMDDAPGENNIFGEIYISTDTASRYAKEDGIGFYKMILRLCCHGFLHLLGYDHENKKDHKNMTMKENYFLTKMGIC